MENQVQIQNESRDSVCLPFFTCRLLGYIMLFIVFLTSSLATKVFSSWYHYSVKICWLGSFSPRGALFYSDVNTGEFHAELALGG